MIWFVSALLLNVRHKESKKLEVAFETKDKQLRQGTYTRQASTEKTDVFFRFSGLLLK